MQIDSFSDSDLLLALCIVEEGLSDPPRFVTKLRKLVKAMDGDGPATVEATEAIEKEWQILRDEADSAQTWLEEHRRPQLPD
jgi:hypothetical protein